MGRRLYRDNPAQLRESTLSIRPEEDARVALITTESFQTQGANMPITKTSWQKGRSGNPRGRHRSGEDLGELLRQIVDRRRFAAKLCELCYAGDVQAMRLLLSYTDGPPHAGGHIQDPEGIQITVTYVQQNNIAIDGATYV